MDLNYSEVRAAGVSRPGLGEHLAAGVLAGVAGLLTFMVIHHIWILPIWFVFPFGLVIAGLGGLAIGWAYAEVQPRLPPRPWTPLAVTALIAVSLLPSIILAEIREPMFDIGVPGGLLRMSVGRAALVFILELLVTSAALGGLAGWWLGRTRRAAIAMAAAGLAFALGPGHNIPFLGGTPGSLNGAILLLVVAAVSAAVLVEGQHLLAQRRSQL